MTGWILLIVGGLLCALNAHPSWLRYPLHRLRGGLPEDYQHASGVPLFGSLLVVIVWGAQLRDENSVVLDSIAWTLVAIDTGGLHWFVLSVVYHRIRGHGESSD